MPGTSLPYCHLSRYYQISIHCHGIQSDYLLGNFIKSPSVDENGEVMNGREKRYIMYDRGYGRPTVKVTVGL